MRRTSSCGSRSLPTCRRASGRTGPGCARRSTTWSATRSSSAPRAQAYGAVSRCMSSDRAARPIASPSRSRQRHRHRRGDARQALQALHPGRGVDDASLRRHRPRPGDLRPPCRAHGGRDHGAERARVRLDLHRAASARRGACRAGGARREARRRRPRRALRGCRDAAPRRALDQRCAQRGAPGPRCRGRSRSTRRSC